MNVKQMITDWLLKTMHGDQVTTDEYQIGKAAAREVSAIHTKFEQLGIKAIIDVRHIVASDTGNFIRYPLIAYGKISSIESIEQDLSMTISTLRGVETDVRIRTPLLAIELPYPLPTRSLLWSDAKIDQLKPFQALLGMDYTTLDPKPAIIDYNRRTVAHSLTAGATGSGKSVLIIGKIMSLAYSTSPDELTFVFCDPKFDPDWKILTDLPHVTMYSEPTECIAAIASVKAELERRKRCPDKRKLILVVDEYADFLGDLAKDTAAQVESHIRSITSVGRSLGIHVDLITQKPTVEIVDSVAKGNLTTRCGGMVMTSKESEIAMGRGGIGCETLPGQGSFYVTIGGGRVQRIQSYLIEGESLEEAIDITNMKHAGIEPYRIDMLDEEESVATFRPVSAQSPHDMPLEWCVSKVIEDERFAEAFPEGAQPHKRAKGMIVEILFGAGTPNQGKESVLAKRVYEAIVNR